MVVRPVGERAAAGHSEPAMAGSERGTG
jgi:hypothetical protein